MFGDKDDPRASRSYCLLYAQSTSYTDCLSNFRKSAVGNGGGSPRGKHPCLSAVARVFTETNIRSDLSCKVGDLDRFVLVSHCDPPLRLHEASWCAIRAIG